MNIIRKMDEMRRREKAEAKRKVREMRRKLRADATQAEAAATGLSELAALLTPR